MQDLKIAETGSIRELNLPGKVSSGSASFRHISHVLKTEILLLFKNNFYPKKWTKDLKFVTPRSPKAASAHTSKYWKDPTVKSVKSHAPTKGCSHEDTALEVSGAWPGTNSDTKAGTIAGRLINHSPAQERTNLRAAYKEKKLCETFEVKMTFLPLFTPSQCLLFLQSLEPCSIWFTLLLNRWALLATFMVCVPFLSLVPKKRQFSSHLV